MKKMKTGLSIMRIVDVDPDLESYSKMKGWKIKNKNPNILTIAFQNDDVTVPLDIYMDPKANAGTSKTKYYMNNDGEVKGPISKVKLTDDRWKTPGYRRLKKGERILYAVLKILTNYNARKPTPGWLSRLDELGINAKDFNRENIKKELMSYDTRVACLLIVHRHWYDGKIRFIPGVCGVPIFIGKEGTGKYEISAKFRKFVYVNIKKSIRMRRDIIPGLYTLNYQDFVEEECINFITTIEE